MNRPVGSSAYQAMTTMLGISMPSSSRESQMKTLGMLSQDHVYTNLKLLFSDQCIHTIKLEFFSGNDKGNFKDRREFSGSILKQLVAVYEYIDIYNKNRSEFSGLERIDKRDYPEEAIREALLNVLVHRDYSYSGSALINIYQNKIEFVSIGGIVRGLTINDIRMGISQTRNEKLAAIFYRLKLIEAYGTGIIKIYDSYKNSAIKPLLTTSENAFAISLPNLNETSRQETGVSKEEIILNYLSSNNALTRKEAEGLISMGQTATGKLLSKLSTEKKIKTVSAGKSTYYSRT